jgi:threonine/homoserine/homoserine lactone efflux protein
VLTTLVAFVGVSALVICAPGQDTALTIRNTLAGGRGNGIATACGVAAGQALWTLAASAGVVALLRASEPVFQALKLAGAAYLVYLGGRSLLAAVTRRRLANPTRRSDRLASGSGFRQGILSNLGNPKMAVFFATLLPQFAPHGTGSFFVVLALGLLFCSLTLAWLSLYAVALSRAKRLLTDRLRRLLDAVTGLVLTAFGARIALESR